MAIVLIPFSEGSLNKNKGTELAPKILSTNLKTKTVKIIPSNIDLSFKNIEKTNGKIFIGGDHSITFPLFKSFSKKHKNQGLIILDAHPDAEVYTKTPSHEDFVRYLIDKKHLKKQNLIYVGLRNISKNENAFLKDITWFKSNTNLNIIKKALEDLNKRCTSIYLSVDTDVIDSKYFKSTGYPEKHGLTPTKLFKILDLTKHLKIKRIDLVEYNPLLDNDKKDLKLVKKILKKLLSLIC
jgi:arginase family enzyme